MGSSVTGRVSPQIGVQPLAMTNAALKALSPAVGGRLVQHRLLVVGHVGVRRDGVAPLPAPPPPPPPEDAVVPVTEPDLADSPAVL